MESLKFYRIAAAGLLGAAYLSVAGGALSRETGPAPTLSGPVADWMDKARQDCPSGFTDNGAVQTAPLTGDGSPGYVIDPHKLVCAGEPHLYVGDGPASIELFVTLPPGRVVHTGGVLALGYRLQPSPQGGPPILAFETHDQQQRAGSLDLYQWDGRNFALLSQRSMAVPPGD